MGEATRKYWFYSDCLEKGKWGYNSFAPLLLLCSCGAKKVKQHRTWSEYQSFMWPKTEARVSYIIASGKASISEYVKWNAVRNIKPTTLSAVVFRCLVSEAIDSIARQTRARLSHSGFSGALIRWIRGRGCDHWFYQWYFASYLKHYLIQLSFIFISIHEYACSTNCKRWRLVVGLSVWTRCIQHLWSW